MLMLKNPRRRRVGRGKRLKRVMKIWCEACKGHGHIFYEDIFEAWEEECKKCGGKGYTELDPQTQEYIKLGKWIKGVLESGKSESFVSIEIGKCEGGGTEVIEIRNMVELSMYRKFLEDGETND